MLRTLVDEGYRGELTFLHYGYTEADVAYLDELRDLAFDNPNVRLNLAYTDADNGDLAGLFGAEHLAHAAPWYADAETFLCGPPGLMKSVRAFLRRGRACRLIAFRGVRTGPDRGSDR
jgi:ferredoxin-NADP reductase